MPVAAGMDGTGRNDYRPGGIGRSPMGGGIFISYRRGDGGGSAGRLYDRLEQVFGSNRLFFDVDHIPIGADFVELLQQKVDECDVLLAVIGRRWIDARDESGGLRLENHEDFVRIEVARGLSAGKHVVPVLVDGAAMPRADQLPDELKPLARRNAARLSHESFKADCDRLARTLAETTDAIEAKRQGERRRREKAEERQAEEERRRRTKAEEESAAAAERLRLERETEELRAIPHARERLDLEKQMATASEMVEREKARAVEVAAGSARVRDFVESLTRAPASTVGNGATRRRFMMLGAAGVGTVALAASSPLWLPAILSGRRLTERGAFSALARIREADIDRSAEFLAIAGEERTVRLSGLRLEIETYRELTGHADTVNLVAFSPGGDRAILTASDDYTARIWSGDDFATVKVLAGHTLFVKGAAWSPDGQMVVTGGGPDARRWDRAGKLLGLSAGHEEGIQYVDFSADGTYFATTADDRTTRVWVSRSGDNVQVLAGHSATIGMASFSADGDELVTASWDNTANLWQQWKTASGLVTLRHDNWVVAARFSSDSSQVLTASFDATAALWETATGNRFATLSGHGDAVHDARFSPDGRLIATASSDGTARLWDALTSRTLAETDDHGGPVTGLKFSSDGKQLLTWSDKSARLWDVPDDILA